MTRIEKFRARIEADTAKLAELEAAQKAAKHGATSRSDMRLFKTGDKARILVKGWDSWDGPPWAHGAVLEVMQDEDSRRSYFDVRASDGTLGICMYLELELIEL